MTFTSDGEYTCIIEDPIQSTQQCIIFIEVFSLRRFKDECIKYGVKVPQDYICGTEYKSILDDIRFPVIVKPTDAAGRKGITICYDKDELVKAIDLALEYSVSKTIVVEQYIVGREYSAIYMLKDGEYSLSCYNINTSTGSTANQDCAIWL